MNLEPAACPQKRDERDDIGGIEALLKGEISVKPLQEYHDAF